MKGRLQTESFIRGLRKTLYPACKHLLPGCIGFMILSCHDSVGPSFRQRGELRDLPVKIDPLNNLQSRVMNVQEAL